MERAYDFSGTDEAQLAGEYGSRVHGGRLHFNVVYWLKSGERVCKCERSNARPAAGGHVWDCDGRDDRKWDSQRDEYAIRPSACPRLRRSHAASAAPTAASEHSTRLADLPDNW